jgi:hypothetical protein
MKRENEPPKYFDCRYPTDFICIPWNGPSKLVYDKDKNTHVTSGSPAAAVWADELQEDWQVKVLTVAKQYFRVQYNNEDTLIKDVSFRRFWATKEVLKSIVNAPFLKRNSLVLKKK